MRNKELKWGIKVEKEHSKTIDYIGKYYKAYKRLPPKNLVFKHIAQDHLKEDKKYYTKLRKAKL